MKSKKKKKKEYNVQTAVYCKQSSNKVAKLSNYELFIFMYWKMSFEKDRMFTAPEVSHEALINTNLGDFQKCRSKRVFF